MAVMLSFICAHCGARAQQKAGAVNRARKIGAPLFCDRTCFGLARRKHKTKAQKAAEKAAYDRLYRERYRAALKAKKHAYFKRTYDPAKAAVERKKRMPRHVEYCRRPEYRVKKQAYDRVYHMRRQYGDFGEAARVLVDLEQEVLSRATRYEMDLINGRLNKTLQRRREFEALVGRHT